ncbi:MAG: dihydropteroate synthase [Pyrinomonadaceae bacterium]|nr:dihydropteroate synthase [Pyrinomonadaceae bacterium]
MWKTSRREISLDVPLVMGILNVTPDSFSDGGRYADINAALKRVDEMIAEGADVIDIGGESTRPGSTRVSADDEISRVVPVIEAISKRLDVPVSIDTSKSAVANAAVDAGAEIINDISGLRFDEAIAEVAARHKTGLVLMHSRGEFETMHSQPPVEDIITEVEKDLRRSISAAAAAGVAGEQIALDIGLGFGKTLDQNLKLIAQLDRLVKEFPGFPILVGASRKSFLGKLLGKDDPKERLSGSLASAAIAVWNGAKILRVHDVAATVDAVKIVTQTKLRS